MFNAIGKQATGISMWTSYLLTLMKGNNGLMHKKIIKSEKYLSETTRMMATGASNAEICVSMRLIMR